jgi:hypothetical protein
MTEHFDRSAAEMPFLLRYQEPGPAPIILAGHYDPVAQRWVPDNHVPARGGPHSPRDQSAYDAQHGACHDAEHDASHLLQLA